MLRVARFSSSRSFYALVFIERGDKNKVKKAINASSIGKIGWREEREESEEKRGKESERAEQMLRAGHSSEK